MSPHYNEMTWPEYVDIFLETLLIQLKKMNVIPLAILGVKWPFSKERGR